MASPLIERLEGLAKRLGEKPWAQKWPYYVPVLFIVLGSLMLYYAAPDLQRPESSVKYIQPSDGGAAGTGGTAPTDYVSLAEQEFAARSRMIEEGLPGGKEGGGEAGKAGARAEGAPPARAAPSKWEVDRRARELRFLAENRREMDSAVAQFDDVKHRYFNASPKVKEINAYFGRKNMPRFMALYDKYHRLDEFELWRRAFMLPEFREGVRKYAGDPEALKAGLQMLTEYSSRKPPLSVVREGLYFAGTDEQTSGYLRENVWPKMLPLLPSALQTSGIPADAARAASGLAGVVSGGGGATETVQGGGSGKVGAPMEWKAKNTWKMDDNMKTAIMHGIDFYLMGNAAAGAVAESDKQDYDSKLKDK